MAQPCYYPAVRSSLTKPTMPDPSDQSVTCPGCAKSYRWLAEYAGRTTTCKQCGMAFAVPDAPGPGLMVAATPEPEPMSDPTPKHEPEPATPPAPADEDDDGLYELADVPEDPPPPTPSSGLSQHTDTFPGVSPPIPAIKPSRVDRANDTDSAESIDAGQHMSEAAKAARREQQRIAAAQAQPKHSWRDHKGLVILGSVLVLVTLIIVGMYVISGMLGG